MLFVVSAILLFGAVVLTFQYLASADERALTKFESADVLVALQPISRGTSLAQIDSQQLIGIRTFPVTTLPKNSMQEINPSDRELVALSDIQTGQILLKDAFGQRTIPKSQLDIPAGMVAVTLEFSYATRVASFIKPGASVAVFSTSPEQNNQSGRTTLLFANMRILAVGNQSNPDGESSSADIANFITVAVKFDEADKLIQASQFSKLQLALLNSTQGNVQSTN